MTMDNQITLSHVLHTIVRVLDVSLQLSFSRKLMIANGTLKPTRMLH